MKPLTLSKRSPSGEPWVMLTAYDALMAKYAESGGADLLLVGDSISKAVLGYKDVGEVSLDDMIHHSKAVVRGRKEIPIIADLPDKTYETEAVGLDSAKRLMDTGVDAVKLEGCLSPVLNGISSADIPVVAHLGYTPQTAEKSKTKVVGNRLDTAKKLWSECVEVEKAGAIALVLEMVPREVSKAISEYVSIPIIGIGSGPDVDGQVLVTTDMWGDSNVNFKFLKKFGEMSEYKKVSVQQYSKEVRARAYPSDDHSFHIHSQEKQAWLDWVKNFN